MSRIVDDDPPVKTGASNQAYRDNYDRIFGEKPDPQAEMRKWFKDNKLSFLERHYIYWRESDDELAKGPGAHGCYVVQNDLDDETAAALLKTYTKWKTRS